MQFNQKNYDTKQRFGIRKLSIGTCSVLLATLFLGVSATQAPKAHAAVVDQNTNLQTNEETGGPVQNSTTLTLASKSTSASSAATSKPASSAGLASNADSNVLAVNSPAQRSNLVVSQADSAAGIVKTTSGVDQKGVLQSLDDSDSTISIGGTSDAIE